MDVEMPGGIDGYQACRMLKDNEQARHVPVMFMSAHSQTEDRLKAYASGGDDYVSKPVNHQELGHKLELALDAQRKRVELSDKARKAADVAMMSMREAADAGVVLQFLSLIFRQTSTDDIADSVLQTLHKFRIRGAVQLRDGANHVSRNSDGACSPVEDAVLSSMASDRRIVDLGARSAFNYERASIIVYDMPLDDPALYGRLKDTVIKMAEGLDTHLRSLNTLNALFGQNSRLRARLAQAADEARAAGAADTHGDTAGARDALQRLAQEIDETLRAEAPIAQPAGAGAESGTELF